MKQSLHNEHVAKINTEITSLKYDLGRVQTPSVRKQIENEISQKEYHLNVVLKKSLSKTTRNPHDHEPTSANITPDPLRKSEKTVQAISQRGR